MSISTTSGTTATSLQAGFERRTLFRRILDFLFGYDYFISYAWLDSRTYAVELAHQLRKQGFECFLDSSEYAAGENWRISGRRAIRKTARLILIGTPGALASEPVLREIEAFSESERTIIPIDVGGTLAERELNSPVFHYITPDILRIDEDESALSSGPSEAVVSRLRDGFRITRQQQKRVRVLALMAVAFAIIATTAIGATFLAEYRRRISLSLALAAQSRLENDRQPDLALLLAAKGYSIRSTEQATSSLAYALGATPVDYFLYPDAAVPEAVTIPNNQNRIAWCDWQGNVVLYELEQRRISAKASVGEPLYTIAVNPDGNQLIAGGSSGHLYLFQAGNDLTLLKKSVIEGAGKIEALFWLADHRVLVSAQQRLLVVFNPQTGKAETLASPHTSAPVAIASDREQRTVITAGFDRKLVFWDHSLGNPEVIDSSATIVSCAVRPDGAYFAIGLHDHGIELWNLAERKPLVNLSPNSEEGRILAVAFSNNGKELVWGGDNGQLGWFSLSKQEITHHPIHADAILALIPLGSTDHILSCGRDRKAAVLDLGRISPLTEAGIRFRSPNGWITATCSIPDENILVSGDEKGCLLEINLDNGEILGPMSVSEKRINSLYWDTTHKRLYAATENKTVIALSRQQGSWIRAGKPIRTDSIPAKIMTWQRTASVCLTETGSLIPLDDDAHRLPAPVSLAGTGNIKNNGPVVAATHPRLPILAFVVDGNSLWWFDSREDKPHKMATTDNFITGLVFSKDGKQLFCHHGAQINCYRVPVGELDYTIQTGVSPVAEFVLLENDGIIASMNHDHQLTFWGMEGHGQLGTAIKVPQTDTSALLQGNDNRLLSIVRHYTAEEGINRYEIRQWTAAPRRWRTLAENTANRELSPEERNRFGLQ